MRRFAYVLAVAVLLLVGATAEAKPRGARAAGGPGAANVHVDRAPDGRGIQVNIDMVVDAPVDVVERMVTDVEHWHDWVPSMSHSYYPPKPQPDAETAASRPFETVVDLPWPFSDVHERLILVPSRVGAVGVRYSWQQVRGDLRRNEGSFTLYPRGRHSTRLVYQANFQLRTWIPMFLVKRAGESQAPKFIENVQRRAAMMAGSSAGAALASSSEG